MILTTGFISTITRTEVLPLRQRIGRLFTSNRLMIRSKPESGGERLRHGRVENASRGFVVGEFSIVDPERLAQLVQSIPRYAAGGSLVRTQYRPQSLKRFSCWRAFFFYLDSSKHPALRRVKVTGFNPVTPIAS